MSKETSNNLINILILLFMALVIAYPVSLFIKNRSDISQAITEEQQKAFISDKEYIPPLPQENNNSDEEERIGEGYRSVYFSDYGSAIIKVNMNNIIKLTKEQFYQVGRNRYSLINTVNINPKTPQVLEVVFNDPTIIKGFFDRETTQSIATNPQIVIDMITNNDEGFQSFINHPAIEVALGNTAILNVLASSQFMAEILATPTAQYFLQNPLEAKKLIEANERLKEVSQNENLRHLLLNFGPTKQAAQVALN